MNYRFEFDEVLVLDVSEPTYHSEYDKSLLYITCTRAVRTLSLLYTGKRTALINCSYATTEIGEMDTAGYIDLCPSYPFLEVTSARSIVPNVKYRHKLAFSKEKSAFSLHNRLKERGEIVYTIYTPFSYKNRYADLKTAAGMQA